MDKATCPHRFSRVHPVHALCNHCVALVLAGRKESPPEGPSCQPDECSIHYQDPDKEELSLTPEDRARRKAIAKKAAAIKLREKLAG